MKIVVDENIPFGEEAFSNLGTVRAMPGREINSKCLKDTTALIVRSVTPANQDLLTGTDMKFVGTATAGIDHIDRAYLAQRQIGFADAAGSNANSVAEYVLTALVILAQRFNLSLKGKTLGIIGVGRIGRLVAQNATVLGMEVILNDPPLAREGKGASYQSLDETLQADFVTLHVPLIKDGEDKTVHLIGQRELARMPKSSILINASRGEVVDNLALLQALQHKNLQGAVLDVWEDEPSINWELANGVTIATPHIAGYSFDGKIMGTAMIYQAACQFFGVAPTWKISDGLSSYPTPEVAIDASGHNLEPLLFQLAPRLYDLHGDDARLRALLALPLSHRPASFDKLRKNYPKRREFAVSPIFLKDADPGIISALTALKFSIHSV